MFSHAKIGDSVWAIKGGWTHIVNICPELKYPIIIADGDGYTYGGLRNTADVLPSLFWDHPSITVPPKPRRMVTKMLEIWVNIYPDQLHAGSWYSSKTEADKWAMEGKVACVKQILTYEVEE